MGFDRGSIPWGMACLCGLLFMGLSALRCVETLPSWQKEESLMNKKMGFRDWRSFAANVVDTVWATGTGVLAGALSG